MSTPDVVWSNAGHPWLRNLARNFDYALTYFILVFAAVILDIGVIVRHGTIFWGILFFLLWIPIEALLLSVFGTTPGKALFNLKVAVNGGAKPSFSLAINRTLRVWVHGLGFGIPLVSMITAILAYTQLRDVNETSWDRDCKTTVLHRPLGARRILLIVAIPVVALLLLVILAARKDSGNGSIVVMDTPKSAFDTDQPTPRLTSAPDPPQEHTEQEAAQDPEQQVLTREPDQQVSKQSETAPERTSNSCQGSDSGPSPQHDTSDEVAERYQAALRDFLSANYEAAKGKFGEVVAQYPDSELAGNAQFYIGEISYRQQDYLSAIKSYDSLLAEHSDSSKAPAAQLHCGLSLLSINRKAEAVQVLRLLVRSHPQAPEASTARFELHDHGQI
jgi:tol-pal system protein YbgF